MGQGAVFMGCDATDGLKPALCGVAKRPVETSLSFWSEKLKS